MTTLLILALLTAPPTGAVPAGEVFVCDFEEPYDLDYDGWPDGWTRARSRELPEFLRVGIIAEPEQSGGKQHPHPSPLPKGEGDGPQSGPLPKGEGDGNHCLQIELDGGGAVVVSPPFAVSPQFSLLFTLRLKTSGLAHDGAWATLDLLDAEGAVLQSYASQPLTTAKDWQVVRVGPIAAVSNKAARGVVKLHLAPLSKHEDLTGRAWFDDLKVVRLPRMTLAANSPTGLYSSRDAAELVCEVSGIFVRDAQVRFELLDHTGQRLAEHTRPLLSPQEAAKTALDHADHRSAMVPGGARPDDGYAGHANWRPPLPDCGFYLVRASLLAEKTQEVLLDRVQSLAVLRPLTQPSHSEFGWSLPGDERPYAFGPLASVLSQAGLGWAKMPVWYDPRETTKADRIAWFAEQLSIQGIELVGVLDQPPAELREVFREQGRLAVATVFAEPALWEPAVAPVMTRLSLKVHWWQLGDDSDVSFVGFPQLETKVAEIKRHLEKYGQQIHLGLNWRWVYAPPRWRGKGGGPWSYLSYGIEPPLTAEELGAYLQAPRPRQLAGRAESPARSKATTLAANKDEGGRTKVANVSRSETAAMRGNVSRSETATWGGRTSAAGRRPGTGPQRWLLLAPLARDEYAPEVRAQDLVMRMLAAKTQGADAVFVPQPLSDAQGILNEDGSPGPLFVPWRTTAMLLGGAQYLGPLQLAGGSTSHVFARGGQAVMAVWSDRPTTEYISLGDEIESIDVWGRATKPPLVARDGSQLHELTIGRMPTFVTGLSEAVARWQATVTFENPQLSSVAGREQTLVLRLRNTFAQGVSGELTLHGPKSWGIDSRPMRFKLAEGEELPLSLPVTVTADANSGPQGVRLDFDVLGYRFSVYRTLQLGLDDVQVELATRLRKDGALLVEQRMANLSDRPLSFKCLVFPPGRRRETRQVINLGRDRTTLVFVLPNGEELIGEKLRLRAEEIGGSRVLNYTLVAER